MFRIADQVRADVVTGPLLDHSEVWLKSWGNPGPSETDHDRSNSHINKFLEYDAPISIGCNRACQAMEKAFDERNENCDDISGHIVLTYMIFSEMSNFS